MEALVSAWPIEREVLGAAAAFLALRLVPLVGEKVFQSHQQECAELPALCTETLEIILLQKLLEERLHQIFGVFLRLPLAPHISVERIPVGLAQLAQRAVGLGRRFASRREHDGPARGDEDVAAKNLISGR